MSMGAIVVYFFLMIVISVIAAAIKNAKNGAGNTANGGANSDYAMHDSATSVREAEQDAAYAATRRTAQNVYSGAARNVDATGANTARNGNASSVNAPQSIYKFYGAGSDTRTFEGKPLVTHADGDCTGGSIHTDRHEGSAVGQGTPLRPAPSGEGRPLYRNVPDKTGGTSEMEGRGARQGGASADRGRTQRGTAAKPSQTSVDGARAQTSPNPTVSGTYAVDEEAWESGADRLHAAIAHYPAAVQGVIWSEVLNHPLSERE